MFVVRIFAKDGVDLVGPPAGPLCGRWVVRRKILYYEVYSQARRRLMCFPVAARRDRGQDIVVRFRCDVLERECPSFVGFPSRNDRLVIAGAMRRAYKTIREYLTDDQIEPVPAGSIRGGV